MSVEPKLDATKAGSTPTYFRCPNSDLRTLRKMSKRLGWSVAELIRRAIAEFLDRQEGAA